MDAIAFDFVSTQTSTSMIARAFLHCLLIFLAASNVSLAESPTRQTVDSSTTDPHVSSELVSPVFPSTLLPTATDFNFQLAASSASLCGTSGEHTIVTSSHMASPAYGLKGTLFGSYRDRSPHDLDGDTYSDITSLTARILGFSGSAATSTIGSFSVAASAAAIESRGGNSFRLPAHEADVAEERNLRMSEGQLSWNLTQSTGRTFSITANLYRLACNEYFGTERDPNAYGTIGINGVSSAAGYTSQQYQLFGAQAVTGGSFLYFSEVLQDNAPRYSRMFREQRAHIDMGVRQQFSWDRVSITAGLTAVSHSLSSTVLALPAFSMQCRIKEGVLLDADWKTGYTAPGIQEGDVQMEPVSGAVLLTNNTTALHPERISSFRLGASLKVTPINGSISAALLYNTVTDAFIRRQVISRDTRHLTADRINVPRLDTRGLELTVVSAPLPWLEMHCSATVQRSIYASPQYWGPVTQTERPFFTPEVFGEVGVKIQPVDGIMVRGSARYTGPMLLPHYTPTLTDNHTEIAPAFIDVGVLVSYELLEGAGVALVGGISNILNHYQPWLDPDCDPADALSQGPTRPRAYFAGLRLRL